MIHRPHHRARGSVPHHPRPHRVVAQLALPVVRQQRDRQITRTAGRNVRLPDLDPFPAAMIGNLADEVKGFMERIQDLLDPGQILLADDRVLLQHRYPIDDDFGQQVRLTLFNTLLGDEVEDDQCRSLFLSQRWSGRHRCRGRAPLRKRWC